MNHLNEAKPTPLEAHPVPEDSGELIAEVNPEDLSETDATILDIPAAEISDDNTVIDSPSSRSKFAGLSLHIPLRDLITLVVMIILVSVGYYMRSVGRNWDDYTRLHPDERFLTQVISDINKNQLSFQDINDPEAEITDEEIDILNNNLSLIQRWMDPRYRSGLTPIDPEYAVVKNDKKYYAITSQQAQALHIVRCNYDKSTDISPDVGGYFDALCSDLNPNNVGHGLYVYGQYPLFSARALAEAYNALDNPRSEPDQLDPRYEWTSYVRATFSGRAMNSVFDTLSIVLVFLIGWRLLGQNVGLLAAGFYTFAAFPIQQSHFWTVDAFTSFWVLLAIYFAVRVMDDSSQYRERLNPLLWIGGAISLWIWDTPHYDKNFFPPLVIYLCIALATSLIVMWVDERKTRFFGILSGIAFAITVLPTLLVLYLTDVLSLEGMIGIILLTIGLTLLWLLMHSAKLTINYMGFFPWLGAAYGLWVYDGMANQAAAQFTSLAVYVIMFTFIALMTSAIRSIKLLEAQLAFFGVMSFLFIGWCLIAVGGDDFPLSPLDEPLISEDGLIAGLVIGTLLGIASLGSMLDAAGFGIAFGSALAGRVNIVPLVGVLFLALLIRSIILWDERASGYEKSVLFGRVFIMLVMAGTLTIFMFRLLQPHALLGPDLISFTPNPAWLEDVEEANQLTSGNRDMPPNHQWTNRVPWLFPAQNIVLYGLGVALGMAAVIGFGWSIGLIARGRPQWTRLAIPTAWVLVYFGWLGGRWVTTMRYFLPLYGMLTIFAAWFLFKLLSHAYHSYQTRKQHQLSTRIPRFALSATVVLLIFVSLYTALYGYGMTSIYTHQLTRVAASRYFHEFVPSNMGLWIERPDGTTDLAQVFTYQEVDFTIFDNNETTTLAIEPSSAALLTQIEIHQLGEVNPDSEEESLRFTLWKRDGGGGERLAQTLLTTDLGNTTHPLGRSYIISFDSPVPLPPLNFGERYELEITVMSGGPIVFARNVETGTDIPHTNNITVSYQDGIETAFIYTESLTILSPDTPYKGAPTTYLSPGVPSVYTFYATTTGEINQVVIPHIGDPFANIKSERLQIALVDDLNNRRVQGSVEGDFNMVDDGWRTYGVNRTIQLDAPFLVEEKRGYRIEIYSDDFVGITGTVIATDGPWDDDIPYTVCPLESDVVFAEDLPSGLCDISSNGIVAWGYLYTGLQLPMLYEDVPVKRDEMLFILNHTDYITISSNRFYDSFSRIPTRWPMSNRYYEALFSGELGFELVKTFESYPSVGPLVWKDQVLPTDDLPAWINEFEAEEAFHVYDHPVVFVFRKTDTYSADKAADILDVNLRPINEAAPYFADDPTPATVFTSWNGSTAVSPTGLQFNQEERHNQQAGGTWSEMFNRDSFVNRNQSVSVVVWWLMMVAVGWVTFPLLFMIFPALPDRGFGVGKLIGWLMIAWAAWFGSTLDIPLWNQDGILFLLFLLTLLGGLLIYRRWGEFVGFIQRRWRHLLTVEVLSGILFLIFLGIRIGNPDLWHDHKGGEKPMDFAYLNAVLRSTSFPAIDPWFAGGYLNYYYWGFVLVGAPIKALGIVPSVAYNLVIPTLFSMTGIGAFSVAYNAIAWGHERRRAQSQEAKPDKSTWQETLSPVANPYIAGIAALILSIGVGNLETPRLLIGELSQMGQSQLVENYYNEKVEEYRAENNGTAPNPAQELEFGQEAQSQAENALWAERIIAGFDSALNGENIPITGETNAHRWHWAPTRTIGELVEEREGILVPIGNGAINEMPYFTFLYGDLHAHMIALPLTLLVLLFLLSEIQAAGRGLRSSWSAAIALFLGATTVGLLKATNSWDWPTYLLLSLAALTLAAWIGQARIAMDRPAIPLYGRLRRLLDIQHITKLAPFVAAIPLGIFARRVYYAIEITLYRRDYPIGTTPDLPDACQTNQVEDLSTSAYRMICSEFVKPEVTLASYFMWMVIALAVLIVLYTLYLVIVGKRAYIEYFPILVAIPLGMAMYPFYFAMQTRAYEQQVLQGEIPPSCQEESIGNFSSSEIETYCKDLIKPTFSLDNMVIFGLGVFAFAVVLYVAGLVIFGNRFNKDSLIAWIVRLGAFIFIGGIPGIAIFPFNHWFVSDEAKLVPWELEKTPLWAYVNIHGLFLFILFTFLMWQTVRWLRQHTVNELRLLGLPVAAVVGLIPLTLIATIYFWLFSEYRVFAVAFPMLMWLSVLLLLPGQSVIERYVYLMAGLALGVSMGVELYHLSVDFGRQNTIFKFYMQVWILFSIVGGIAVAWLIQAAQQWNGFWRGMWNTMLTILLTMALLYPLTATPARFKDRLDLYIRDEETPLTLDGMEYMLHGVHWTWPESYQFSPYRSYPVVAWMTNQNRDRTSETGVWFSMIGDYEMIRWLQDHVQGTPTIIEAQTTEYQWGSRISIYTGLPTVMGWRNHQSQQRNFEINSVGFGNILWNRINNVQAFYETPDIDLAWDLIEFYQIEYIIVGTLERIRYYDVTDVDFNGVDITTMDLSTLENPAALFQPGIKQNLSPGIAKFDRMKELGMLELVYEAPVCLEIDAYTITPLESCPTERLSTNKIYRVVPKAQQPTAITQR